MNSLQIIGLCFIAGLVAGHLAMRWWRTNTWHLVKSVDISFDCSAPEVSALLMLGNYPMKCTVQQKRWSSTLFIRLEITRPPAAPVDRVYN